MDIDVSSLQQFYSAMKPIMDTIPQVLEMAEKKADFDRTIAAYAANVEASKAILQATVDAGNAEIDKLHVEIANLNDRKTAVLGEIATAEESAKAAVAAATDAANTAQYAADAAVIQSNARANEAEMASKARIAAAEQAFADQTAAHEQAIADLQAREAQAKAALDALRTQLG